jgi:hypothetical protein
MIKINALRSLVILMVLSQCYTHLSARPADSLANSPPKSALQLDLINPTGFFYLTPVTLSTWLRIGLNTNMQTNNGNSNSNNLYQTIDSGTVDTQQTSEPMESHSFSASATFTAIYANDFITSGPLALYAGLGPFATYSRSYSSSKYVYATTSVEEYNSSSYSWTYGAKAILGIQIAVIKEMGIHAEYGCSVGHQNTISHGYSANYNSSQYENSSTTNSISNFPLSTEQSPKFGSSSNTKI